MTRSVADTLRKSRRPRWITALTAGSSLVLIALLVVAAVVAGQAIKNHNTIPRAVAHSNLLSHGEIVKVADIAQDSKQAAADQTQREADAAALAVEQQQQQTTTHQGSSSSGSTGPVKCPPGTVPNAVDGAGNESNCAPPCQAYDDNNVCTSPGSLVYVVRDPETIQA